MEATSLVTDLLIHCPKLRILVTSRTLLRVAGEHALPVPPLELPNQHAATPLEELADMSALQLFTERARDAVPSFALSDANVTLIADICRLLSSSPRPA